MEITFGWITAGLLAIGTYVAFPSRAFTAYARLGFEGSQALEAGNRCALELRSRGYEPPWPIPNDFAPPEDLPAGERNLWTNYVTSMRRWQEYESESRRLREANGWIGHTPRDRRRELRQLRRLRHNLFLQRIAITHASDARRLVTWAEDRAESLRISHDFSQLA